MRVSFNCFFQADRGFYHIVQPVGAVCEKALGLAQMVGQKFQGISNHGKVGQSAVRAGINLLFTGGDRGTGLIQGGQTVGGFA